jgi:hypothetical protein
VEFRAFLISALHGRIWSTFTPQALYVQERSHRYTYDRYLVGLQSLSGYSGETIFLDLAGNRNRIPQLLSP